VSAARVRIPATCPLDCPDACGVLVENDAEGRFASLRGNPEHSWSRGTLCGKTMLYGELVRSPARLLAPLVREGGRKSAPLVEASWEDAIDLVARRVGALRGEDVLALWYGGSMGLVQRKFPLRMMHALGATLHDGGICDAASTAGYQTVLGRCIGPDLERAEEADLVLLWGCDASRTVQHLLPALQRLCRRGVPVIAIDVWKSDTIQALERWGGRGLVLAPGSDAALPLCLARIAFEVGRVDREALERDAVGAAEFEAHLRTQPDLEETASITGIAVPAILELYAELARARAPIVKTGVGWTRRRNGAIGMRAVCSLAVVLGAGERVHYESFEHFGLDEAAIERADLRPRGAPDRRVAQVTLGRRLSAGEFRAAFVWCHDPAVTLPDSRRVRAGLARDDLFLVVHDHFLTETAELADVVLPATMFVEHSDVYRSYGQRVIQWTRAPSKPPPGPRSNVETFSAIARALGLPGDAWDVDADELCAELIERSRARFTANEFERLASGAPVKLAERAHADRGTPSGRFELASAGIEPPMATWIPDDGLGGAIAQDPERGAFWLIGAPSIDTHNSTYAHSPRHLAKAGPPRVHVHPDDARALGLEAGGRARLSNARGAITLQVALDLAVPRGRVRVDGLPRAADIAEGVGINALTAGDTSDQGSGNVMYSARVDLAPV
jgi:anaerobic selenocysteine-containing dehydrogenase